MVVAMHLHQSELWVTMTRLVLLQRWVPRSLQSVRRWIVIYLCRWLQGRWCLRYRLILRILLCACIRMPQSCYQGVTQLLCGHQPYTLFGADHGSAPVLLVLGAMDHQVNRAQIQVIRLGMSC